MILCTLQRFLKKIYTFTREQEKPYLLLKDFSYVYIQKTPKNVNINVTEFFIVKNKVIFLSRRIIILK